MTGKEPELSSYPASLPHIGVKICGVRDLEALQVAAQAGADWIGLVFFSRSPRYLTPTQAAALVSSYKGSLPRLTGLFVKASDETIQTALDEIDLDILQIYDTPERAQAIRQRFGKPVWLSCAVHTADDLPADAEFDGYVIEPRAPKNAANPGGNGVALNWSILRHWRPTVPWMLAGGLTPENVGPAILQSGAPAVDVSSGVETRPGEKSAELIRNFVKNARSAGHGPCATIRN
ncbi:phosphoribosylanthranilate isomerase [Asaia krungthepensis]|uniref:N-(5'-phosphoribosyl)anthranilate isomerase n=1 Tax=Asaia krungthepensis NRIC 0535 TaxID=1307925 RepID=A0ABQ0PWB7_9PROT|nr:phosphoribosylanthranilate isomerase [Asaia krungthepensis]GBQ83223.1 phosphoribosyl anthranilate isomerase [Asaia krungthepensis NRIC 0535]